MSFNARDLLGGGSASLGGGSAPLQPPAGQARTPARTPAGRGGAGAPPDDRAGAGARSSDLATRSTASRARGGKADSDDEDELDRIFNDEFPRVGAKRTAACGLEGGEGGGAPLRPVVVVDKVAKRFKRDPVQAVKDAVAPYHDPGALDNYREELLEIAAMKERTERRKDEMFENREMQFIALLQGMLPNTVTIVKRTESVAMHRPRAMFVAGGGGGDGGGDDVTEVMRGGREGPGFGPRVTTEAEADAQRIMRNGRAAMEMPSVSGRVELTREGNAAVRSALLALKTRAPWLFGGTVRENGREVPVERRHFFVDDDVMTLFAELVSARFALPQIRMPNRPYLNSAELRRKDDSHTLASAAFLHLEYDARRCGFVMPDPGLALQRAHAQAAQMIRGFHI